MLTEDRAHQFARDWIDAWNSHDLERILVHYDDDVTLKSPLALQRFDPSGTVQGKSALSHYFGLGLKDFPDLRFELVNVLCGVDSVLLYYTNQEGSMTGELMELGPTGRIVRVLASYGAERSRSASTPDDESPSPASV